MKKSTLALAVLAGSGLVASSASAAQLYYNDFSTLTSNIHLDYAADATAYGVGAAPDNSRDAMYWKGAKSDTPILDIDATDGTGVVLPTTGKTTYLYRLYIASDANDSSPAVNYVYQRRTKPNWDLGDGSYFSNGAITASYSTVTPSSTILSPASTNTWYSIAIVNDVDNSTFTYYVEQGTPSTMSASAAVTATKVVGGTGGQTWGDFEMFGKGYAGAYFADFTVNSGEDFKFGSSTVPEPASLALLGIGGLVMLRRRRGA